MTDLSRMVKSLQKTDQATSLIKDGGGNIPDTPLQSHKNLLAHHFPGYEEGEREQEVPSEIPWGADREIFDLITPKIVKNALNSFSPNKSSGPDEFRPKTLQNLGPIAIGIITETYRRFSLLNSYIPPPPAHEGGFHS